jgi:hypothetical protein
MEKTKTKSISEIENIIINYFMYQLYLDEGYYIDLTR